MDMRKSFAIAVLLIVGVIWSTPGGAQGTEKPFVPFLGAYIHFPRWFDADTDQAARERVIAENLDRFRDAGLRVLIPYVVNGGEASYESRLFPKNRYGDWDPLAVIVREARRRGLQVYPAVCVLASGHKQPQGVLKAHPEWALRDKAGEPTGFISSGHPEAREWVVAMLQEIVSKYQPDGLLLDYLRFPGDEAALDPVSQAKFDAAHPVAQFPRSGSLYKKQLLLFKRQCLTELVGQISDALRAMKPKPQIAVYMWGAHELNGTRDWRTWADRGYLDMLNLTGYAYRNQYGDKYLDVVDKRFADVAEILRELNKPVELTICVGIRTSHGKIQSVQDIEGYLQVAKRHDVQGAAFFTWASIQPYLPDLKKAGYIKQFTAGLKPAQP